MMQIKEYIILIYNFFKNFSLISAIKLIVYGILRKINFKRDSKKIISINVNKLNHTVYIRPYLTDYALLIDFYAKETHEKGGHYEFSQIDKENIHFILDGGG